MQSYVESAIKKGLDPNKFGQRISFFFNSHNGFLEEISKFRAARKLWASIMRDRFGVTNKRALMLFMFRPGVQHLQLHKLTIILLEQLCKLCLQFWEEPNRFILTQR